MAENCNLVEMEVHIEEPIIANETTEKARNVGKATTYIHATRVYTAAMIIITCIKLCCELFSKYIFVVHIGFKKKFNIDFF